MGKGGRDQLAKALKSHMQSIHETFQMLEQSISSSLEKIDWSEVTKVGNDISKQATVAGMLWSGEAPNLRELEENMGVYCNMLQGFLLLCHGSMVGAGPTLGASIRASAEQVIDSSLSLLREGVSSYESHSANSKLSIPQLAGYVWEACEALKKTPTTNYTAIGRAITQVAVSVKDVLREMKDLKPCSIPSTSGPEDLTPEGGPDMTSSPHDEEGSSEGDLGNDLSPDEMLIAQSVVVVVSDVLIVIKEIIRFVMGLLRQSNDPNSSSDCVDSLERLLEMCKEIGIQVDELGACVYPPQEVSLMKAAAKKISGGVNGLRAEIQNIEGPLDGFFHACEGLESSLRKLDSELSCLGKDLVPEMQGLAMQDHARNT